MINRGAILLRYKAPAVDWINEADPYPEANSVTIEEVNRERTIYLVSNEVADNDIAVREWVRLNFDVLFENELEGWYVDESLWPPKRTYGLFEQWFAVECHSVLRDTVEGPIFNDET